MNFALYETCDRTLRGYYDLWDHCCAKTIIRLQRKITRKFQPSSIAKRERASIFSDLADESPPMFDSIHIQFILVDPSI